MDDSYSGTGDEEPPSRGMPLAVATVATVTALPPDVVRLLDVLARIELRRRARLRELRSREAS